MTINVGFDFDEPIYPWYDLAHQAMLKDGLAQPDHEPTGWAPHETYGCTLEEWVAVIDRSVEDPNGMYHQPFKTGVIAAIRALYVAGYGIHIITARGSLGDKAETIKRITKSEIIRQGLPYTSLTFTPHKGETAHLRELDYFLDDRPKHWEEVNRQGVETYLLDERWNRDFEVPPDRRLTSTQEYCKMIMNRHGTQHNRNRQVSLTWMS